YQRRYENDTAKWINRLDQQVQQYQKPDNYTRVIVWIGLFGSELPKKVQEHYSTLDFAKKTNAQIQDMVRESFDRVKDNGMARSAFSKLQLENVTDEEKDQIARYLWTREERLVETTCQSFSDKDRGKMELLRFYQWDHRSTKGIPLADEMTKVP